MDKLSQERLAEILRKEPKALSQGEIDILRARESYLSADQKDVYAEVLEVKKADKPLEELTERQLARLAKSLELDPNDFDTPETLIAAIREKQSAK
jgi:hypothetical protein